jgi:hypothetical protein
LPRHIAERGPAQPASRREQRHCFEDIGLACAILAGQHNKAAPRMEHGFGMIPEVGEEQARQHRACS